MKNWLLTIALLALPGLALGQGGTPAGAYNTGGNSSSSSGAASPGGSINPGLAPYNAKFDVTTAPDISTTNGSNIITCPNNDCKFLTGLHPASVGMIFFGNSVSGGLNCLDNPDLLFGGLRETTISSVDSDSQIHVVGNAGATNTAGACGAWGHDDTTAINTAWFAGGCTSSQWLPMGIAFINLPIWQPMAGCPSVANQGTGYQAPRVWGTNVTGTYIMPRPSFNFASVSGSGAASCAGNCLAAIGNPNIADYENFLVWGLGERCTATLANTILMVEGISTRYLNAGGVGWCARGGGTTLIGVNVVGITDGIDYAGFNYFGSIELNFNQPLIYFGNSFVSGNSFSTNNACMIQVSQGASIFSVTNNINGNLCVGGTWNSINTTMQGIDASQNCISLFAPNAVINFLSNDIVCTTAAANEGAILFNSSGGIVRATNSQLGANGTAFVINGGAGNTFEDQHDNTFTGGAGRWNSLGNWVGDGSLTPSIPTISSGFGTSPAILKTSGTTSFTINVGTGGTATAGVIGLPATNAGWTCSVYNQTAHASNRADDTVQTANTTTTVTVQNQTKSTGAAVAWTASDTLNVSCRAN